jgi:quinol monooxygenase YgiN
MSVTVTIHLPARADRVEELVELFKQVLPDTRSFQGCESVVLHQSQDDPTALFLYEQWASRSDQEAYMAWRTETGLIAQIVDKLGGGASFGFYDTVDGETAQR